MPVTTLDPRTAPMVIDLQKGITPFPTAHPIRRSRALADAFRRHRLPVVLVNVTAMAAERPAGVNC